MWSPFLVEWYVLVDSTIDADTFVAGIKYVGNIVQYRGKLREKYGLGWRTSSIVIGMCTYNGVVEIKISQRVARVFRVCFVCYSGVCSGSRAGNVMYGRNF